jgi:hypothetical protein
MGNGVPVEAADGGICSKRRPAALRCLPDTEAPRFGRVIVSAGGVARRSARHHMRCGAAAFSRGTEAGHGLR